MHYTRAPEAEGNYVDFRHNYSTEKYEDDNLDSVLCLFHNTARYCPSYCAKQYFRHDATDPFAGARSVVVGKSTSNQRIERWWGTLRQNGIHWWINFFKDLRDTGTFNELDAIQCENLKFRFMDLIQTE
ncbi:uncharacterized protein LOC128230712 [Mya arenaria]|uniref:uncharacterized protein LOC128230712 n=1 Tax=Mya arenaria TaxID=6604 RepID=UPI0022E7947A|nr:uncharacterized protein LOC128230712 [Mya arenaria]